MADKIVEISPLSAVYAIKNSSTQENGTVTNEILDKRLYKSIKCDSVATKSCIALVAVTVKNSLQIQLNFAVVYVGFTFVLVTQHANVSLYARVTTGTVSNSDQLFLVE